MLNNCISELLSKNHQCVCSTRSNWLCWNHLGYLQSKSRFQRAIANCLSCLPPFEHHSIPLKSDLSGLMKSIMGSLNDPVMLPTTNKGGAGLLSIQTNVLRKGDSIFSCPVRHVPSIVKQDVSCTNWWDPAKKSSLNIPHG